MTFMKVIGSMTVAEVAEHVGVSRWTMRREIKADSVHGSVHASSFSSTEIERWLNGRQT